LIKVVVFGASGMLGSMLLRVLSKDNNLKLIGTVRNFEMKLKINNVTWKKFNIDCFKEKELKSILSDAPYIINCIGVIKPYIHDDNPIETERAIRINSLFPYILGNTAAQNGAKVLQIATDCVYSGFKGRYNECDKHDPLDVYGKTKSLGELYFTNMFHLRCSIIGFEQKNFLSLLEWFLKQPKNAKINGYTNHLWNGVSTMQFGKICLGVICNHEKLPHVHHIIPKDIVTKYELLQIFAEEFNRKDITITPVQAPIVVDRTLSTMNPELNKKLWNNAGYKETPTISEMITELNKFN
jgi:dTDP-4-dehydrorhamnose reductase